MSSIKKLLNTLYINTPNRYLSLDGETVCIKEENKIIGRIPLHNLEGIVTFGYTGVSPSLMRICAEMGISVVFMNTNGKFLAEVRGNYHGNVLLRKEQYRISDDQERSLCVAKNFIIGKVYNSRAVLSRMVRDYSLRIETQPFLDSIEYIKNTVPHILNSQSTAELIGWEEKCAVAYFNLFDDMILQQKDDFCFDGRNRRPPMDNVNALLSFTYSIFSTMCASALESVGLDPYVGFLHKDRPGRMSLALDLMEEFRSVFCDRFVLKLINKKIIKNEHFTVKENGAVFLTEEGRKIYFQHWQDRKADKIKHPFLSETIELGTLPYVQALLLARYIRGDIDEYPPFFWK